MTQNDNKKRLVLIDSNALIHRAYHALPPLSKKDGTLTNAVYGYAVTLFGVLEKLKPDYIAATFDLAGPTFRHVQYDGYKATRVKADEELYQQIPLVKQLLKAFNIPIYEKQGFEADDVIGTIAKHKDLSNGVEKFIVTGDLDTLQLVDENTKVFTLRKGINDTVIYDIDKVRERFNLTPEQVVDYKALRGDQSDNIPGVKGIGEKTAIDLLVKYKTLENVYENLDKISPSVKKKLESGKENAQMSKQLAQIDINVPIEFDMEKCRLEDYDKKELLDFLRDMEFYSLVRRIDESGASGRSGKNMVKKDQADLKIKIVSQKKDAEKLAEKIAKKKKFSFSLFSTDSRYYRAKIKGMGVFLGNDNKGYFVPVEFLDLFNKFFQDKNILKIGYNEKLDFEIWAATNKKYTVDDIECYFDVQIAAYLLRAGTYNDLEKLIFEEFGKELAHKLEKRGQASLLDNTEEMRIKSSAEKAIWIWRLHNLYSERIDEISDEQKKESGKFLDKGASLRTVFEKMELPLIKILAKMEMAGVKVNSDGLNHLSSTAKKELIDLEKKIYEFAGGEFNINSPSQLAEVLYEKLEIPTQDIKRGKTGYSTDADQLRKIRLFHPIVELIEKYRETFKIKTTYTDALPLLVEDDGRIHASFNQAVTATGRLSSSDPNLQNIPKKGKMAKLIRENFVADDGYVFVAADYSQIDLRAAAHLSGDKKMIEIFNENKDIHRATAAWVNDIPESEVTDAQRSEAKSLNFGVLYGMGTYGFMRDSGVSRERAEFFIKEYMKTYSSLKEYLENTKNFARNHGYVETPLGRRRYIPNLEAANIQLRNAAERMAINLPVQGLSADIMKLAMLEVEENLMKKYADDARLILQIHDEVIFEVKEKQAKKFAQEVKSVMEKVYKLKVPLVVEVEMGKNWSEV